MILELDYETWSPIPIRRGTDAYLAKAAPLLATWAIDEGPVNVTDFTKSPVNLYPLFDAIASTDEIWAHNAFFDRTVTERLLGIPVPRKKWRCTMAQALLHSLPGGLDALCHVLGVPADQAKIADGKRLIRKFCCGESIIQNDPEWQLFIDYAVHDILAMRACRKRMPNWNYRGWELDLWHLDQEINSRGFKVDVKLADAAIAALKVEKEKLDSAIWIQTCGSVESATQRDKLLLYLCEQQGCVLGDLTAPTIEEALNDESLDESTKAILRIRQQASKTSVSKYRRLKECLGYDDRLRATLQHAGASRTSRWAARLFQPHNMPRPTMGLSDTRNFIEGLRNGGPEVAQMFAPLAQGCSNSLRGLIIAPEKSNLFVSDYSAIEGRVNSYIADETWKIDAYSRGVDLYCEIYERSFELPPGTVTKKDPRRQMGKVQELALGYEGGVGAFLNMAAAYRLDLEEIGRLVTPDPRAKLNWDFAVEEGRTFGLSEQVYVACDTLKLRYRAANPMIAASWKRYKEAAMEVINSKDPNFKIQVGPLMFDCDKYWLRIRRPSGSYLCYALPMVHPNGDISYLAWRNKQWSRTKTYGGKLCENIVQAIARDILADGLLHLDKAGFPIVLHVHDEAIAEVTDESGLTFEQYNHIMQTRPDWLPGFPLAAEGYSGPRYEKR